MKNEITDEKLKNLFREMRVEDESEAPDFEKLVRLPVTYLHKFAVLRIAATITIVILLGAIASLMMTSPKKTVSDTIASQSQESWAAISNWQASTDILLASNSAQPESTFTTSTDSFLEFTTTYNE
jgi:uncharacterized membrane protein YraQ (UPF0718 family)